MLDREKKTVSRNKDIKLLHEMTGWSYKECRTRMKANHWDISKVLGDLFDQFPEIISNTLNVMREALNLVSTSCQEFICQFSQAFSELLNNSGESI